MALPVTMKFGKFKVLLGDGGDPEVFAAPCGFTQRSFQRSKELSEVVIPPCGGDEDAMAHTARDARSLSASISGSGVLAKEAYPVWKAAYESAESVNCKIEFDWTSEVTTITQKFHLSSFEMSADLGDRVQVSVQMESDGGYVEVTE